jgi:alcohol dehydrogenase class IV
VVHPDGVAGFDRLTAPLIEPAPFSWRDGERLIRFGPDVVSQVPELLGGAPYALLTTPRAKLVAPDLASAAASVHHVGHGLVDAISEDLRGRVTERVIVAVGGGRVIDTAKAIAAAAGSPSYVVAVPTTLSGAEMTAIHRLPSGVSADTRRVRPRIVVNDPAVSASQEDPELTASAVNALGHCAEAPLTPRANPVATLAALEGAGLIVAALDREQPDRARLALGALLAGYAIDSAGYGLHHVMSQTLVRFGGVSHSAANAVMLPHTLRALGQRFPAGIARLGQAMGGNPASIAARLAQRAEATSLRALGVDSGRLMDITLHAAERTELALTPPAADAQEIWALYKTAL